MANNCLYEMHVMGSRPDVEEFITILQYKHPEREIYRVFSAYVNSIDDLEDGKCVASIDGDCAWSIASSMARSEHGSTTLLAESEKLNLEIEVYSEEPGCGFEEHFWYEDGECIANEVEDLTVYWWDRTMPFEDFKAENHLDITPEQLNESDEYRIGGFRGWNFAF